MSDVDSNTPLNDLPAAAAADPTALGKFVGVSVALRREEGVEPDVDGQAIATGEAPETGDSPPHVAAGMVTEVTVD